MKPSPVVPSLLARASKSGSRPRSHRRISSYHVFGGDQIASTVLNYQVDDRVQPALLDGVGPLDVFRHHFATTWEASTPLESVIAEQAIRRAGLDADAQAVSRALRDRSLLYRLDDRVRTTVTQHAAFRHSSSIIFVVGLPGSGKSFTRRHLAERLGSLRIQTQGTNRLRFRLSRFPSRFHQTRPAPVERVSSQPQAPSRCRRSITFGQHSALWPHVCYPAWPEVTLVEFARSDILAALQEFGEESIMRSQIVYVEAPTSLREERLRRRERPPELAVSGAVTIFVTVSDDHRLPSAAQRSIYGLDDIKVLRSDQRWHGRILRHCQRPGPLVTVRYGARRVHRTVNLPYMTAHR